jgi:enamine deaminase RidA (YjgF/YER057c/UK114 family)
MSPGVEANGFLFLTGIRGARPSEGSVKETERRITAAFETVREVLSSEGAAFSGAGR